jgi:hypothetical protein
MHHLWYHEYRLTITYLDPKLNYSKIIFSAPDLCLVYISVGCDLFLPLVFAWLSGQRPSCLSHAPCRLLSRDLEEVGAEALSQAQLECLDVYFQLLPFP